MKTPSIWIVEDNNRFINSLEIGLESKDLELNEIFQSVEELFQHVKTFNIPEKPDVLLLDNNLPGATGVSSVRELKILLRETRIIMLTINDNDEVIFESMRSGTSGYILKTEPLNVIISHISSAIDGGTIFSSTIADRVLAFFRNPPAPHKYNLTERELEILLHLSMGLTQKEIALKIGRSPFTVNAHLQNVYTKLHVNSGIEAVSMLIREGVI